MHTPAWRRHDLGQPLPNDPHAVSVAIPCWDQVIGYEEGDPAVIDALKLGYPRFFRHPRIGAMLEQAGLDAQHTLPFSCRGSAEAAARFADPQEATLHLIDNGRFTAVTTPAQSYPRLWQWWQHSGEILSSRMAEDQRNGCLKTDDAPLRELTNRLAKISGVAAHHISLHPTGMAAVFAAFRAVRRLYPQRDTVQFGFPYVDTLKIQEKLGRGAVFLSRGDDADIARLAHLVQTNPPAAVFCEQPSNPLMQVMNLAKLSEILRPAGIPLIVDNTLDSGGNAPPLPHADLVVTSLTKFFSGVGDVMAGALQINAASPLAEALAGLLSEQERTQLYSGDAQILLRNAADFESRMDRIEETASAIATHLRTHPLVAKVHTPAYANGNTGGIFSIELQDAAVTTPRFYDQLQCSKGPSLGTNFTLVCPYTMLAHYHERAWAVQHGVAAHLIRISVGLEPAQDLIARFHHALALARSPNPTSGDTHHNHALKMM